MGKYRPLAVAALLALPWAAGCRETAPAPGPRGVALPPPASARAIPAPKKGPGGDGWRAVGYSMGDSFGSVTIRNAYLAVIEIDFDPDFPDVARLNERDWEVRGPEEYGRPFEVFAFTPDRQPSRAGPRRGTLIISGPASEQSMSAATFRLKRKDGWVTLGDVPRKSSASR